MESSQPHVVAWGSSQPRVVAWGKTGELCAQYLDKGRSACIEGRIQTRSWDDKKTGDKRYMTEIIASNVTFLGTGSKTTAPSETEPPMPEEKSDVQKQIDKHFPADDDKDIPF